MLNDKRLLKCACMVSGKGIVCDVGTDHAYLPVYLVKNNLCKSAIASDIADGPLDAAKANIAKYGLSGSIETVKSDGLENICPDGISDVIIAGMGAETISDIIKNAQWLKKDINIILQPMTKTPFLRRWLYENGFEIIKEEAVCDNDFIYTVMNVKYSGYRINVSELFADTGMFNFSDKDSLSYARKQYTRIKAISDGIKRSGKTADTSALDEECIRIKSIADGDSKVTVGMIYDEINRIAPFHTQDSWDNSGLLVGERETEVTSVLTALDITHEVIDEAIRKKANLIISHHPVIFHPLKKLSFKNPAVRLAANGISAICVHTPLDKAVNGINDIIADMLEREFRTGMTRCPIIPDEKNSPDGDGRIVTISGETLGAKAFAQRLKAMFGDIPVRYTGGSRPVKKVAVCSGSGGSLLSYVVKQDCDAYITGDVKHDVWLDAAANDISLFDCGHFYTEQISAEYLMRLLRTFAPGIRTEAAESSRDITEYIF